MYIGCRYPIQKCNVEEDEGHKVYLTAGFVPSWAIKIDPGGFAYE